MAPPHSARHTYNDRDDPYYTIPTDQHQNTMAPNWVRKLPLATKNHFVAAVGEFVGTFMFLLFAFGGTNAVNTAGGPNVILAATPAKCLYICLAFGMSLAVNVWIFYRVSGGLFNPAVTVALMAVGAVGLVRGIIVIASQLLGGICAAALLRALLPGPLLVDTTLRSDTNVGQGLFIEVFLTSLLVLTILLLAVEKHRATYLAPVGIGLALFVAELMGVPYTGGSLNPARSFGPCVATATFQREHWIYWLGPIIGALLAAGFYKFIKALEYETVNPGQDEDNLHPVVARAPNANDLHQTERQLSGDTRVGDGYKSGPVLETGHGETVSGTSRQ